MQCRVTHAESGNYQEWKEQGVRSLATGGSPGSQWSCACTLSPHTSVWFTGLRVGGAPFPAWQGQFLFAAVD